MSSTHLAFLPILLLVGCSTSSPPAQSVTAAECVLGWYDDGPHAPCAAFCQNSSAPAECSQQDCELMTVDGFMSDHTYYSLLLGLSGTTRTSSTIGSAYRSTYQLQDAILRIAPGNQALTVTSCDNSGFVASMVVRSRIGSEVSAKITENLSGGILTWKGQPIQH